MGPRTGVVRPVRRELVVARTLVFAAVVGASGAAPLAAQFPAELAGQVLDAATHRPLEGARVRVPVTGLTVETDAAGRFRLKGLPAGEWDIEAAAIGYRASRTRVSLADGRVEQASFSLEAKPESLAQIEVSAPLAPVGTGVSVIGRDQIDRALAPDVPALLSGQSGVTITQRGGPGSPASVSIRGSSAHEVLVLVDGVPLNDPTTGEVDLAAIPLEQIERVTILRGAAAARYGSRALAGVIAIERRHSTETEGWLTLAAGAWGERIARGGLTAVRTSGNGARTIAGSLSGGLTRFDGDFGYEVPPVRGGGAAERANGDGRNNSLLGSVRFGGGHSLTELRGDYLDIDRGLPGSFVQPTLDARQAEHRIGAGLSTRQTIGTVELRGDVDASSGKVRYADPAPPMGSPYDDSVRVRQLQATVEAGRTFGVARVSAGVEGRWLGVRASNLTDGAPADQPILSSWLQATAAPALGSAHPTFTGGLRVDRDDGRGNTYVSPSLGVSVPVPGATVQLSWAMAFAPPTLADQFFQPGVLAQPNPDLRAERVRNDWQLQVTSGTLQLGAVTANGSLSLFRADVDGMILWFPNFRFVWSPDNYDVRRRGAELSATVNAPLADLALTTSLSDAAVEYRGPVLSGQVAYRPRHTVSSSLAASAGGFRSTVRFRYTGRRRAVAGSDLNTLDPFGVTDLQVVRRLPTARADLDLALALDDIFDRAGTMLLDYPSPGRTWRFTLSVRARRAGAPDSSPTPARSSP
jgi:vitamin B12 transporter